MYIRCTTIKTSQSGEPYKSFRLVETERVNGKVKQRTLINLGRYFDVPLAQWHSLSSRIDQLLTGQSSFLSIELDADLEAMAQRYTVQIIASRSTDNDDTQFEAVDINTVEFVRPRRIGIEHLALHAVKQLMLDNKLKALGFNQRQVAAALGNIIGRMSAPASESGIYASMDLNAPADDLIDIEVTLKVGGRHSNTYMNFNSGDKLTATLNNSDRITLSKHVDTGGEISYVGAFGSNVAGVQNSIIKISFESTATDVSTLHSSVILPAAPSGLTTPNEDSFDRSTESIGLTWNASNMAGHLALTYQGDCIINGSISVVDIGVYTTNAGTIKDSSSQNCQVTFTLYRATDGTLDPAYGEGGYIRARQSRPHSVISRP